MARPRPPMLTDLITFLTNHYYPQCRLRGVSCNEKGRGFTLNRSSGDSVIGYQIDGCILSDESPKCDCLFICMNAKKLAVILVELKGNDAKRAIYQIKSTAERLCRRRGREDILHPSISRNCTPSRIFIPNHHGIIFGIVVCSRVIPLAQKEKKQVQKEGWLRLELKSTTRLVKKTSDFLAAS